MASNMHTVAIVILVIPLIVAMGDNGYYGDTAPVYATMEQHWNKFDKYSNYHVLGGEFRAAHGDVVTCCAACVSEPSCRGVDFSDYGGCFFHTASTECGKLRPKKSCVHFRLKGACKEAKKPQSSFYEAKKPQSSIYEETKRPHSVIYAQPEAPHSGSYEEPEKPHVTTYVKPEKPHVTTYEEPERPHVTTYVEQEKPHDKYEEPEKPHDKLYGIKEQTHSPVEGYVSVLEGYHISGGRAYVAAFSREACLRACAEQPSCQAADYKSGGGLCFFHDHGTACNSAEPEDGVTHYRKTHCNVGGWVHETLSDRSVPGGRLLCRPCSPRHCLQECSQHTKFCLAADYDYRQKACYFHTDKSVCRRPQKAPGVTHYKGSVNCNTAPAIHGKFFMKPRRKYGQSEESSPHPTKPPRTSYESSTYPPSYTSTTTTARPPPTKPVLLTHPEGDPGLFVSNQSGGDKYYTKSVTSMLECFENCRSDLECALASHDTDTNYCFLYHSDSCTTTKRKGKVHSYIFYNCKRNPHYG